jgi:hypothetical protein
VCALLNRQNMPMRPAKNIQRPRSQLKILLKEFFEPFAFLVFKRRSFPTTFLQNHSTRYADFWMVCIVVLFYTICRIAKKSTLCHLAAWIFYYLDSLLPSCRHLPVQASLS